MKYVESRELEFPIVEDFLTKLKKESSDRDNKSTNIAELKKVEQRSKIMKEFVQEFRRTER